MGIFDRFPYSSTHEMNLDFMLGKATEIAEDMQTVATGMAQVQAGLSAISEKTEQATQAAAQAAQSASSIEGSVTAAEEAAEEAQMHNESAQTWANNAMTYKADCQRSATEAAASSTSAAQAATAAAGSEDTVAQYAQAANASAQSAANNNDSAHQYANQASASASNATFHSSNAQTAATNANTSATNAETAATNAQTAATRASALKDDCETLHRMCVTAVDLAGEKAVAAANSAAQAAATKTDVETLVESLPEDFTDLNNTVNQLSDEIVDLKRSKISPLFIDPISGYNWVSMYEISAFSSNNPTYADGTTEGNNGYFNISGSSGNNYVSIIQGGNANISALTSAEKARWLGGVIVDDDGIVTPCNFFYKSDTEFYVYPTLTKNITNGQLAGMQTGMHLSKRGYKGYAQYLWGINPKHGEKNKYIAKYRVGDEIPFTVYGGKVGATVDTRNIPVQYQNKYSTSTYVLNMDWGDAYFHNTETGIQWTVNINGQSGYVEAYVGDSGKGVTTASIDSAGASYSFDYANGAEVHCDLYVDGVLVDSYSKKSKKLERVCLDYNGGNTATLKIYSNMWQATGYGFSIGAMTWWINDRWNDSAENPYMFKAITQLFDSWGVYQNHEVQNEIEALHENAIGTPVPINNKSMGNMTSQWGRLWFYQNVQKENATVMMSDFGINDYNSSVSTLQDEIAPDGSTWPVHFTITSYSESICKLLSMATKNNILPVIIGLGYRNAGNIIWAQAAIDAYASD